MMARSGCAAICLVVCLAAARAQAPDVPASRFAGTWVGTQAWAIPDAPPGARGDQPVSLVIEVADGRISGTMRPFLGGEDGATFVEAAVAGEELRATAVVGRARPASTTGGRGGGRPGGPPGWKDATTVRFTFTGDAVDLTGRAEVRLGDVPWMTFTYTLRKQRSRY